MCAALRLAFLGARGSFSEEAARAYAARTGREVELLGAEQLGSPAPGALLAALARGACDLAVLPVANSAAGLVWPSLQALGQGAFELLDEVVLPVRLALLAAHSGVSLAEIERVASHPMALAQCARTLARLVPGRAQVPWSDTASAARDLAAGRLDARTAVLASERAGEQHGLAFLARDVHDQPDNRTFFAVLRHVRGSALQ
jgi:prephenate dehydratase